MSDPGAQTLNSKYAWRELARRDLPKRSAKERAADFLEIYGLFDEATAREQANRCIQCPNPSCVSGCPLCNPIPEWMQLTAEGRFLEAAALLGSATNMAEICARLCPTEHLCEGACLLESVSQPVSIRAIEQFLIDYAFAHRQVGATTAPPNGRRVAVVGSGPGGLAAADELARKGYAVTVFDSALVPGGLLVQGTPAFRLDHSIIERRLDLLKKQGVRFHLGVRLGQDLALEDLRADFDAVYLGFDARAARPLTAPGAGLRGVVPALPFLLQKSTPVPLDLPPIDIAGKRVVVLGGGDSALDCLRTALRYGAGPVTCVYRRDTEAMPCGAHVYQDALEEGGQFVFRALAVTILDDGRGAVRGVTLVRTQPGPADASGRPTVQPLPGTEFEIAADWVVVALGFEPAPYPMGGGTSELALNGWGGIVVDEHQKTSLPGVFAGGDIVRGPTPLLHAVRDARHAAAAIQEYLSERRAPAK